MCQLSTEKRNQFVQLAPLALTSYLTGNESVSCVTPPFKTAFHCYLLYNGQEMKEKHLRAEVNTDTRLLFFWLLSEIVEQKLVACETDNIRRKPGSPVQQKNHLMTVSNTRRGYVKRHKLVRSHLKSRSIALPLTKPVPRAVLIPLCLDEAPPSPCLVLKFHIVF